MLTPTVRATAIAPFYVMEIVKAAAALQAAGRDVIHMSIGEPDFGAAEPVREAAARAVRAGDTGYTPALGLTALREAIAAHYADALATPVDPASIVVTAGASGALLLALATLLERDAELLMPDPSYPCNRHFAAVVEARARLVPCDAADRFQLTRDRAAAAWSPRTAGLLLASPSNPTGTTIPPVQLRELLSLVDERQGFAIVDEIYQGLTYGHTPVTALALGNGERLAVINSFSKYFGMTGWRLGWLVVPPPLVPTIERLAQNLFICASAIAQHAALACFTPESTAIFESRRAEFARRRDYLVPALRQLGFGIPVEPDGAFYIYADISRFAPDSWDFAFRLLAETGVCVVPGRDFGAHAPQRHVRISYATSLARLQEAIERLDRYLPRLRSAA